jgi:hypothetical protein
MEGRAFQNPPAAAGERRRKINPDNEMPPKPSRHANAAAAAISGILERDT